MKDTHQVMKIVAFAFLSILVVLSINQAAAGILHFKMTAPKTTLTVNEEVAVTVSAWVDDPIASPNNGLITWQVDLSVNNTGILEITKTGTVADITLLAPPDQDTTFSTWDYESVNSPITGEVREVVVVQRIISNPSYVGVEEYTDIFTFNIQALSVGTAVYTIRDDGGGLFFGMLVNRTEYDNDVISGSVVFDASTSDHIFTVVSVPEPISLTIFAFAGLLAALRKK
jgi:hypothetical protein